MELVTTLWWKIYLSACIFTPCIVYQIIMYKSHRWNKGRGWHLIWSYIFILYLCMALDVAGGAGFSFLIEVGQLFNSLILGHVIIKKG